MGLLSRIFGPPKPPPVMPVHVDDGSFADEVLRSDLPVMLDVWGPGCAPCRQLEPIVVRLANRYAGRVKVAELNAAEAPRSAARLGIQGTPTVVFLKRRREVERVVGFRGELYLEEIIETDLLGGAPPALR
jgi:thioredoxin-like negative regulator of GroEL